MPRKMPRAFRFHIFTSAVIAALAGSACRDADADSSPGAEVGELDQAVAVDPEPPPGRTGPVTAPTALRLSSSTYAQANFSVSCGGNADAHALMARVAGQTAFRQVAQWRNCARGQVRTPIDATVQPGQSYCWKVLALNETHEAETPLVCGTIPVDPRPISAAPGLRVVDASQTSLAFYIADNSDNETGFRIHARRPGGTWSVIYEHRWPGVRRHLPFGTELNRYQDHRFQPDTTWEFRAEAFKEFSPHSLFSAIVTASTLPLVPTKPEDLRVVSVGSTTARLEWTDALHEDRYQLHADQSPGSDKDWHFGADTTSFEATGLTPDADVCFLLYAHNIAGHGDSDYVCTHTAPLPETEHSATTTLEADPPYQGVIPFVGKFPGFGNAQGTLLSVELSQANSSSLIELQLISPTAPVSDCSVSGRSVRLPRGRVLGPADFQILYGTPTPRLPVFFRACASTSDTTIPSPRLDLVYRGP